MTAPSVMQVMAGAEHGGAEAFFDRLVCGLADANLPQTIVVRDRPGRVHRLTAAGLDPVAMRFGGPLDAITRLRLRRLIAEREPRVVLAWMNRATAACPARVRGTRFVFAARLGGYYDLKYYRRCDHLVANTRGIEAWLHEAGWPEERVHYLPNFVEPNAGTPARRGDYATPEDAQVVLAAGRLHRNKAFDVAIRAVAEVPGAFLWIAGAGPEAAFLARLARDLNVDDRVRMLGWQEDLSPYYRAADVFVCSSRHEPLGNIVIEAWAHGCPVVAAAAQGPTELIRDGADGILVPVEDHAALAAALRRVLGDPALADGLTHAGTVAWQASFDRTAVIARYLAFFEKLAA